MTIQTNTTDRKALARAIAEELHTEARYLRTPTYAYEVGDFTVDRDGNIVGDDFTPLMAFLLRNGYITEDALAAQNESAEATAEPVRDAEASAVEPAEDACMPAGDIPPSEDTAGESASTADTDADADADSRAEQQPDGPAATNTIDVQTITIPAPDITVEQLKNLTYTLYSRQYILNLMTGGDTIHIPLELIDALKEALPATPGDFTALLDSHRELGLKGFDFRDGQFSLTFPFYETEPTKWTTFAGLQGRILQMALAATRVFPELIQPDEEAEKYTAHMWLQRMGYKGPEMKGQRNILLKHLHARDAIVEIKKRAITHQFDVLLVFMFDRLGRRDDETPFVVQWFVQQGIEVWSTREGEQRFDTHVDKLLNYIRFWQASGESEKTAIRVRTKHSQMIQEGQWRGGLVPYGYRLEFQGRTNKRNKPVRDLMIDEEEGKVVREIFHLLTEEGYGTNRVAQYLNDRGIKTKRGTTLWRGTSIRALIDNPVYIGVLKFGDERSEPFEHLRLIDDATYERCLQTVKARATKNAGDDLVVPLRTDSRGLLTGILYCGECGNRLCYCHNTTKRKRADGTIRVYERDLYRCYRKISSRHTCAGQSTYDMQPIIDAVEAQVRSFLGKLASKPREELLQVASARNTEMYKVALKQAEQEYEKAQKQVTALEEEAVKALTGESALDLSVINGMIIKHRAKRDAAAQTIEEARARLEQEQMSQKETQAQIDEILSWADCYDKANIETRHMIIARIIEKVEVRANRKIHIKFRISLDQFFGKSA